MARAEYLICREGNAPPPSAALPEPLYRPFPVGAVLGASGNQVRNRFAVSGYGDGLTMLDRTEEFGQARLGFGSLNLTHM